MKKNTILLVSLFLFSTLVNSASAPWVGNDFNGNPCKGNTQGYGPFDYTNEDDKTRKQGGGQESALQLVESAHFPPESEYLLKPTSIANSFLGDFDYTLRAWPNHHRALLSLSRFQIEVKKRIRKPDKFEFSPVECYFQRAFNFLISNDLPLTATKPLDEVR